MSTNVRADRFARYAAARLAKALEHELAGRIEDAIQERAWAAHDLEISARLRSQASNT